MLHKCFILFSSKLKLLTVLLISSFLYLFKYSEFILRFIKNARIKIGNRYLIFNNFEKLQKDKTRNKSEKIR